MEGALNACQVFMEAPVTSTGAAKSSAEAEITYGLLLIVAPTLRGRRYERRQCHPSEVA